jgi:hypothetical protein
MTEPLLPRPLSGPVAQYVDMSDVLDRGPITTGTRDLRDTRTHIDRISPYNPGESYAGAGGNAVVPDQIKPVWQIARDGAPAAPPPVAADIDEHPPDPEPELPDLVASA